MNNGWRGPVWLGLKKIIYTRHVFQASKASDFRRLAPKYIACQAFACQASNGPYSSPLPSLLVNGFRIRSHSPSCCRCNKQTIGKPRKSNKQTIGKARKGSSWQMIVHHMLRHLTWGFRACFRNSWHLQIGTAATLVHVLGCNQAMFRLK